MRFLGDSRVHARPTRRRTLAMCALLVSGVVAPVVAFVANGVSAATYLPPPTNADSCGYPVSSSAYANYQPTTKTSQGSYGSSIRMPEQSVIQGLKVYGVGLSAHIGLFANDESDLLLGVQTKSSSAVPTAWQAVSQTTLTGSGLQRNTQYTTLSVAALPVAYATGDSLTLISGGLEINHITVAQPAAQGATTITVNAFSTGHNAFPAGTIVVDTALPYGEATNPSIGDPAATELTLGGSSSRPDHPALYLTNLTQPNGALLTPNTPAYYAGDWEQGGTGTSFINAIYGDWATDNATSSFGVPTFASVPNNWDLGPYADTPPFNPATQFNQGYGSEVVWNASSFAGMTIANQGSTTGLIPGDTYRIQALAPEVDPGQRGTGGAESCTTFVVPGPPTMHTTTTVTDPNNATDTATSATNGGLTAPVGFEISDTATLTPITGFGNPTGTITFNLYKNDSSCVTTPVFTDTENAVQRKSVLRDVVGLYRVGPRHVLLAGHLYLDESRLRVDDRPVWQRIRPDVRGTHHLVAGDGDGRDRELGHDRGNVAVHVARWKLDDPFRQRRDGRLHVVLPERRCLLHRREQRQPRRIHDVYDIVRIVLGDRQRPQSRDSNRPRHVDLRRECGEYLGNVHRIDGHDDFGLSRNDGQV